MLNLLSSGCVEGKRGEASDLKVHAQQKSQQREKKDSSLTAAF